MLESVHSVTLYAIVSVFITLYSKVKINCQLNRLFSQAPKWMVNYFHKLTISLHLTITRTTSHIIFTWQYHYIMVNYFHKLQSENLRLFSQYNLTVQLKSSINILCDIIGLQSSRPAIRQRMGVAWLKIAMEAMSVEPAQQIPMRTILDRIFSERIIAVEWVND